MLVTLNNHMHKGLLWIIY